MKIRTGTFSQKVTIPASAAEIYSMLMESKKHTAFTGASAKIGKKEGDAYTAYDGYIVGRNIELKPGKKIVQTWRAVDGKWPEDHESIITFDLKPSGKNTVITFIHADVPVSQVAEFKKGWKDFYWEPLKNWFASR